MAGNPGGRHGHPRHFGNQGEESGGLHRNAVAPERGPRRAGGGLADRWPPPGHGGPGLGTGLPRVRRRRQGGLSQLAAGAGTEAGRDRPPDRRGAAGAEAGAGDPGVAGDGQIAAGRAGRSAGDDRHLRLRRRPVAPALRGDDGLGAARASALRTVPSPGGRRHRHRLQFPGGGLGLECDAGGRLRRHLSVEAVVENAAHRHRRPAHPRRSRRRQRPAGGAVQPRHRPRRDDRRIAAARSRCSADLVHRLDPGGTAGRRNRRRPARPHHPRTRRQQRHHRDAARQSRAGGAGDRLLGGGHRRPALHHHPAADRPSVDRRPGHRGPASRPTGHCGSGRRSTSAIMSGR